MVGILEGNRRLYALSRFNKSIGLPSMLVASLVASVFVALPLIVEPSSPLTAAAYAALLFMVVDAALILLNLLVMNAYFNRTLNEFQKTGLPYSSLSGVEAIQDTSTKETRFATVLFVSSVLSLTMFLLGILGLVTLIYLSLTSSLITFGFSIIKRRSTLDPQEVLEMYEPDVYPTVVGSDTLLETFIDPFHRLKFDDYKRDLATYLRDRLSIGDALSKITFLLYQAVQGVITEDAAGREIAELLRGPDFLSKVMEHPTFGFKTLRTVISKMRRLTPELTRLIDRLFLMTIDNLPDLKAGETVIDVEASWERRRGKMCNSFILLYNNQKDKTQRLTVNYSAPGFSPISGEISITLPTRDFDLPTEDSLPIYSEVGMDSVGLVSRILDNTRFVWFSFETKETGVKPVVITVRDRETGVTLLGKTFMVEAYYDLNGLLLKIISTSSVVLGVLFPLLNFMRSFLRLW